MKRSHYYLITCVVLLFVMINGKIFAQDTLSGIVKYQQTTKYDFSSRTGQRWKDYVATLPQEGNYAYVLYFAKETALYEENAADQEELHPGLHRALHAINYGKPPKPEMKKVFYELENQKKVEQIEFMTRYFIVESDIESKAWKITNEKRKILSYICLSAELKTGEQTIKAWFTPQIPVSLGPGEFSGLPGLILAVEKNGETFFIATSVKMTSSEEGIITIPADGKKVTQEEFDKIIEEKVKEFEENPERHKSKGHKGRK